MKQNFSTSYSWNLFFYLTKIQFFKIVRHPGFLILTLVCFSFLNSNFIGNVVNSEIYPTTGFFLNQVAISEFPIILITLFFVGEIVWRKRHVNASAILDAYPVKNWVLFSSKITTVLLVQFLYAFIIVIFGIAIQKFYFDYHQIELGLYLKVILGMHLIYYWIITLGFFFVQLLSPNKYIGFLVSALLVILVLVLPALGLESMLFQYGSMPDYRYSAFNGLGPFSKSLVWYSIYWLLLAAILFMLCFKLWPRGNWKPGLRNFSKLFRHSSRMYISVVSMLILAFICCGIYISVNKATMVTSIENFANYEKLFSKFENSPVPSINRIQLKAELFPKKRKVLIEGIRFKASAPIFPLEVSAIFSNFVLS